MTTLIQRIIQQNYKIKVWHIIIFNFFFYFTGEFINRYTDYRYVFEVNVGTLFSIAFTIFLIFINGKLLRFIIDIDKSKWLVSIFVGFVAGIVLWYISAIGKPLIELSLNYCNLDSCHSLWKRAYADNSTIQYDQVSWYLVVSMVFHFAVITPIREELMFRCSMSMIYTKRYGLVASSLLVAAVFAVFHLRFFITTFVFSLVMSALVLKYRNILPAVVAHGTFNTFIYFLYPSIKVVGVYTNLTAVDITVFIILLVGCFYFSIKSIKKCSLEWLEEPFKNK
ncbi:MAG: membrane protease YdiL (CAAX protease family) [Enterobacterales bacterium]|jgi:membrane protease YdiL (CAAX protease family)